MAVYLDAEIGDDARRAALYKGDLFLYSKRGSVLALANFARSMVLEAFSPHDPRRIHEVLPVEECVEILAKLKPAFIHHPKSKVLIQAILEDFGCDPDAVHFDVPRLRSAMPADYLTAGIAYAFHPHRDTWYSAPFAQINWWLPVFAIVAENAMAFHPRYFNQRVRNSSDCYDYSEWNATSRFTAAQHTRVDTRVQPHAIEPLDLAPDVRLIGVPGSVVLFSAQHLHSTVRNTSGAVRFSVDFRTVHVGDILARREAPNVDSRCTGTALGDFLRASDLEPVPRSLVEAYASERRAAAG